MLYNRCAEVDKEFWRALAQADPEEIVRRTGSPASRECLPLSLF